MTLTLADLEREQEKLSPKEDLAPYAGLWVALRDGHVVTSSTDAVLLRNDPAVRPDDLLMAVPATTSGLFLL